MWCGKPAMAPKAAKVATEDSKGDAALKQLQTGEPMGKNAAQACMDWAKAQAKKGWDYPLQSYRACKTRDEKVLWGMS